MGTQSSSGSNYPKLMPEWLTPMEACLLLGGLKPSTLEKWRITGTPVLPFYKFGRLVRYRREDVEAFIKANRYEHTSKPAPTSKGEV